MWCWIEKAIDAFKHSSLLLLRKLHLLAHRGQEIITELIYKWESKRRCSRRRWTTSGSRCRVVPVSCIPFFNLLLPLVVLCSKTASCSARAGLNLKVPPRRPLLRSRKMGKTKHTQKNPGCTHKPEIYIYAKHNRLQLLIMQDSAVKFQFCFAPAYVVHIGALGIKETKSFFGFTQMENIILRHGNVNEEVFY